jgi:hypothetical protein
MLALMAAAFPRMRVVTRDGPLEDGTGIQPTTFLQQFEQKHR